MKVTEALVRQVADLARLELTDEEVRRAAPQLQRILGHVESVQEVDVAGADPAVQAPIGVERLRDDVPGPALPRDAALKNAPKHDGTFFVVPKFFEE